jgi:trimethylamine--corrinoid protein Co-methyltransferase
VLYPEELVLDTDIYHQIRINAAGLDTSKEALALDVIKDVGPRGHYLGHRHTRIHLRKREYSDLTRQVTPEGGVRNPMEVAREKTAAILEHHRPLPLDGAQRAALARILRAAERELEGR